MKIKTPDDKRTDSQTQEVMDGYNKENWLNAKTIIRDAMNKEEGVVEIMKEKQIDLIAFSKNQQKSYLPSTKRSGAEGSPLLKKHLSKG
ncbi:hypothetical protein [Putridiphycobacter roseus]|uniref:hypothetical protein n=1 Tax=Putridiphycobacter roseus TaxID=2219161 RepID=UPI0011B37BE0|nr:hypothetical protein [Putridiphycobacter roseus]